MNKCDKCGNELNRPEHLAQLAEYQKMVILALDGDDTRLSKYEVFARILPDEEGEDAPRAVKGWVDFVDDMMPILWAVTLLFAALVGFLHLMNWAGF